MDVLLDARIGRKPTGIGNYVLALAGEVARQSDGSVRPLVRPQHVLRFRRLGARPVVDLRGRRPQVRCPPDVAHGPNFHADGLPGRVKVATVHDVGYLTLPECHPAGMPERLDALVRRAVGDVALFVCNSEHTRRAFAEAYGLDDDRLRVVPMGVDATALGPEPSPGERDALRRRLGLERPYLLHVGAMVPRKDLLTLVQAFDLVADEHPELELVLAGNKTLRWASDWPAVEAWLEQHPHRRDRVRAVDYVPAALLPALYRQAEAVVLTALLEGFGMTVLEAFACRTPAVASRAGALPEVGRDVARYGTPKDPASYAAAIVQVLAAGPDEARSAAGRAIALEHSWARTAAGTLGVYAEAAAS